MKLLLFILLLTTTAQAQFMPAQSQRYISKSTDNGVTLRAKDVNILFHTGATWRLDGQAFGLAYADLSTLESRMNLIIGTTASSQNLDYISLTNPASIAGTPTRNDGSLTPNGTNNVITSDLDASTISSISIHATYYSLSSVAAGNFGEMGYGTTSSGGVMRILFTSGATGYYGLSVNPNTNFTNGTAGTTAGVFCMTRVNATGGGFQVYRNGSAFIAAGSGGNLTPAANSPFYICGLPTGFTNRFSNKTVSFWAQGAGFTAAQALSEANIALHNNSIK